MKYDTYNICAAYYWFFTDYHGGQWSRECERLCKLSKYFKMSPLHYGIEDENYETKEIYRNLCIKHGYVPIAEPIKYE